MGIVGVLWAGWPQPHIRHHDPSPLRYSANQAIDESIPVPLQLSKEKDDEESLQAADTTLLVDLNLGSRMELEALPGIGVKLADRIVSYRAIHGAFQQVEDLVKVSGIGKKRLQRLEPFVKVPTKVKERQS